MRRDFRFLALGAAIVVTGCHMREVAPDTQPNGPLPTAAVAPPPFVPSVATEPKPTGQLSSELPPTAAAQACLETARELEKGGFEAEAIGHYEHARGLNPKAAEVSGRLAVLYGRNGDDRRALLEFDKSLKYRPNDPDILNDLGYFHVAHENWSAAEECLGKVVAAKPDHARAWANLAVVYAKTGRLDESRKAFAKVVSPAEAEYNLGVLLAGQGRTTEARECLRAAANLDPHLLQVGHLLKQLDSPVSAEKITPASTK